MPDLLEPRRDVVDLLTTGAAAIGAVAGLAALGWNILAKLLDRPKLAVSLRRTFDGALMLEMANLSSRPIVPTQWFLAWENDHALSAGVRRDVYVPPGARGEGLVQRFLFLQPTEDVLLGEAEYFSVCLSRTRDTDRELMGVPIASCWVVDSTKREWRVAKRDITLANQTAVQVRGRWDEEKAEKAAKAGKAKNPAPDD